MEGRKADGYIKKELKKDAKSNVKDDLGKKEAGTKKPKGVSEFKAKGVTGSIKVVKEGIEEILREKLAKKKADEAKVDEYMGTQYGSSEDMAVDMLKKGITEKPEKSAIQKMKEALKAALKTEKLDPTALKTAVEKGTTLNISKTNASDISAAKSAKANFTTYE
jgi:hypothetical protein